jgi:hypothetical protein
MHSAKNNHTAFQKVTVMEMNMIVTRTIENPVHIASRKGRRSRMAAWPRTGIVAEIDAR